MFQLQIDTDNAAFADDPGAELARILSELASRIDPLPAAASARLRDANGNTVGRWTYSEDEDPDDPSELAGEVADALSGPPSREPYVRHSPDPPELWTLIGASGRRVADYETQEEAEAALVDYRIFWTDERRNDS